VACAGKAEDISARGCFWLDGDYRMLTL